MEGEVENIGEFEEDIVESKENKSKLGYLAILLITINSIMGTGIFFLPAVGAREAGLFSIFSWVVMGLIAIYFSMMFAELVGLFPKEGGVYEYAKEAFGSFPSFLLGWMTLVAANITIAMLMVGAIKYIGPVLPNEYLIGISVLFIILFNFMAFKGLKTGAVMLIAFALITLGTVFGLLVPGLINLNPANFTDWFSHAAFSSLPAGLAGWFGGGLIILITVFFIAETFFGWETATFLAEKVKNPRKVMPKVMIISTVIIAIISLLFVIASMSIIPWQEFSASLTPLSSLAQAVYGSGAMSVYSILVYLAIIGSVAGWIVASPNLLVALAKDKLFLTQLAHKHKKMGTPHKAIFFQTVLTSVLVVIGAGSYETLLHLLVPLVLILYGSVVLSLLFIRKKYKHVQKTYTAPGGSVGPILLILFIIFLIVMWATHTNGALKTLTLIGSFIIISIPIYLLLIFFYNPDATLRFQNQAAYLSFLLEGIFLPKRIVKLIMQNSVITQKIVLELGASSGRLSREIAKHAPHHQIIIEQSEALKRVLQRRVENSEDLTIIHDEHLTSRIHPDVHHADEIFSFGILSDLHDPRIYLKHIAHIMPENGRIHFFDYVDLYKVLPNKELLNDLNKLKKIFHDEGFAVNITKKKGLLWNYLIIDGIKTHHESAVFI